MEELIHLLRPAWGAERWILDGWQKITPEDKACIKNRMDCLFKQGLPFEIRHDKSLYLYTFSLLAQLEVLAIQIPLKFKDKMVSKVHRDQMHRQLLDEIFHGLVFTKIVYLLSSPYAYPPAYNDRIEVLCNFIRQEECPRIAVVLLNLIGEGWIEEIFASLQRQGVAPEVFETILIDEHRHVCEADLYRDIGLPDTSVLQSKLAQLESLMVSHVFLQYQYMNSLFSLLTERGSVHFLMALNKKHRQQLSKINLLPGKKWLYFMRFSENILTKFQRDSDQSVEVSMTPARKIFMTQWNESGDPTMVGEFNVNVSCLELCQKKYPPETLTVLMLQAASHTLSLQDSFRQFLKNNRLYCNQNSEIALIVKLPGCQDHIGSVIFKNCHLFSVTDLYSKIKQAVYLMAYCYKQRLKLEGLYPELKAQMDAEFKQLQPGPHALPPPGISPALSVSNISACGFTQGKSPLRRSEVLKLTLFEVDRKLMWDRSTQSFEAQDILPVSLSADHRIFDGNIPIAKFVSQSFNEMFLKMTSDGTTSSKAKIKNSELIDILENFIAGDIELAYKILTMLQTTWIDFVSIDRFERYFLNRFSRKLSESL